MGDVEYRASRRVQGFTVGLLGNNGVLIRIRRRARNLSTVAISQQHSPLVFLRTLPVFMVGKTYEEKGIISGTERSSINAVSNSTVPAITDMIEDSVRGRATTAMAAAYEPRSVTWRNHALQSPPVMGGAARSFGFQGYHQRED